MGDEKALRRAVQPTSSWYSDFQQNVMDVDAASYTYLITLLIMFIGSHFLKRTDGNAETIGRLVICLGLTHGGFVVLEYLNRIILVDVLWNDLSWVKNAIYTWFDSVPCSVWFWLYMFQCLSSFLLFFIMLSLGAEEPQDDRRAIIFFLVFSNPLFFIVHFLVRPAVLHYIWTELTGHILCK